MPISSTGKVGSDVPRINDITHGGARPKTKPRPASPVRDEEGWTTVQRKKSKKSTKETINSKVSDSSKAVPSTCKFHLQGRCQFGRAGDRCPDSHPGLCRSFIARSEAGCGLGAGCPRVHPKLCKSSLKTRTCSRKNFFYYHVKGTIRTNRLPAAASLASSSKPVTFSQPGTSNQVSSSSPFSVPTVPEFHQSFSQVVTSQPPPASQRVTPLAPQGHF